jgi:hypothetical protein
MIGADDECGGGDRVGVNVVITPSFNIYCISLRQSQPYKTTMLV